MSSLPVRWRKTIYWTVGIVAFYALFGFFALPAIVKSVACQRLTRDLHRETTIGELKINPFALSLTVRGFQVTARDGQPWIRLDEVYVNFQASSIYSGGYDFREFRCEAPYFRAYVLTNGLLNFADLLESTNPPAPPSTKKMRPVRVERLRVDEGRLVFEDHSRSTVFETEVGPFTIAMDNFSTAADRANPYSFAGTTKSGETFGWSGDISLDPFRSHGTFELAGIAVRRYSPFFQDNVRFEINRAVFQTKAHYALQFSPATNFLWLTNASMDLKSVDIIEKGKTNPAVSIGAIDVAGGRIDLLKQVLDVERVSVRDGSVRLNRRADGSLDLAWLFTPVFPTNAGRLARATVRALQTNAPATPPPAIDPVALIRSIELTNFAVALRDDAAPRPVELVVDQLDALVRDVSNQPGTNTTFAVSLRWNSNGVVRVDGQAAMFPPSVVLQLGVTNLSLLPLDAYLDPLVNVRVQRGSVTLGGTAQVRLPSNAPPAVTFNGNIQLDGFAVNRTDGPELVRLDRLALEELSVQADPPVVRLGRLSLDGPVLEFIRDVASNNFAGLLKASPPGTNAVGAIVATNSATPGPLPRVDVVRLVITNAHLGFSDRANRRPVQFSLDQVAVELENISNQAGTNTGLHARLRLNTNGTVAARGTVALFPPVADLQVQVGELPLPVFDAYLDPFVNLVVSSGALGVDGRVRVAVPTNGPPTAKFQGAVRLDNLATTDGLLGGDFVKLGGLSLTGLDVANEPLAVSLQEFALRDFEAHVMVDGPTNNIAIVLRMPMTATSNAPAVNPQPEAARVPSPAGPAPRIAIQRFALTNVNLLLADRGTKPPVALGLRQISGTIGELSSESIGSGQLNLSGKFDNTAPFNINGRVSILTHDKDSDLKVGFHQMDLKPFAPYIARFLGYQFVRGRLDFDVAYQIQKRQLKAKNRVVLDQFTLGDRVASPDAVKAPIKLGLAILRDGDGKIELDLPIEGSLDDPNFRYGKLVWKAVGNIFLKAATAPFALLGSMFGGKGGEELAFQDFKVGGTELPPESLAKLAELTKALAKRPALKVDIAGGFDPEGDAAVLRREKLNQQLKLARFNELRDGGQANVTLEQVTVTPADYTNLIFQAWAKLTGTNTPAVPARKPARRRKPEPVVLPAPLEQLEKVVLEKTVVPEADLKLLGDARAQKVKEYLLDVGKIAPDRLFIAGELPENATNRFPRVYLQLR